MENIDIVELSNYNMRIYSEMANQMRAIPDARTGLKPIHQKILYEMWIDGIRSNKKYNKCAKMVGQVISRFSEHGDSATYDALVRLAQPWIQRYPLLDFHGNLGSQFGDGPASMRYTESKLSPIAEDGFLSSLDKECIDWTMNYTNEEKEPKTLPAVFPGLFCLSNQGMGYGCACNFLTFNLKEVASAIHNRIEDKPIDVIYYDLPTGGTIVNPQDMHKIMETGKGTVIVESKYEKTKKGFAFTEIPFNVMFDDIVEQIKNLYENGSLPGITDVRNESGKDGIRLVIDISSQVDSEKVLNVLFSKTSLRTSYAINQVALVDNWPKLLSFYDMCDIYIKHNLDCIKREYQFEFDKNAKRLEILRGLSKALDNIESVISIIKGSKDSLSAKKELIKVFNFTQEQADAILEMKLSKLANIEKNQIDKEICEREKLYIKFEKIVKTDKEQKKILLKRLDNIVDKYDNPRRTDVIEKKIEKTDASSLAKSNVEYDADLKTIKKFSDKNGKYSDSDFILCLSDLGNVYRIKVEDIPTCKKNDSGIAIGTLIALSKNETIMFLDPSDIVFITKDGYVKKIDIKKEFNGTTRNKSGMKAIKKDIVGIVEYSSDCSIALYTKDGYSIQFSFNEIPNQGKAGNGVIGIKLNPGDFVEKYGINVEDIYTQRRGGKGKKR